MSHTACVLNIISGGGSQRLSRSGGRADSLSAGEGYQTGKDSRMQAYDGINGLKCMKMSFIV